MERRDADRARSRRIPNPARAPARAERRSEYRSQLNLAGFCRNCLAKWYRAAAEERGLSVSDEAAREMVYGMPYSDWKAKFQK